MSTPSYYKAQPQTKYDSTKIQPGELTSLLSIFAEYGRDVSYMSTDSPTAKSSRSMNGGFSVDPFS